MPSLPHSPLEAEAWLRYFFQSQDGLDPTQTSNVYAADATLHFASYPAVLLGSKNIEEMVAARFAKLDIIRHVARYFDLVGSRLWAALDVTYRVKGDPAKEDFLVPCICVFTLVTEGAETGKIADLDIYMDQTAVAERMESVAFYTLTSSNGSA